MSADTIGRLSGKIALVTGAAMGNGQGIAKVLLSEGATVILADVSEQVNNTAAQLGERAVPVIMDVTDKQQVDQIVKECEIAFGRIDILVNNAGIAKFSKFTDITDELRNLHIQVNLFGPWNCAKAVLPIMLKNKYGRIINMASVTGPYVADPGEIAYATTKAALIGFTKALAIETAADHITVNALCPGYILTPMVMHSAKESNPQNPQAVIDGIAAGIPMKRLGTTKNIGDLVAFLASDAAEYITGQDIIIDGGNGIPETNTMGLKN
jgi:NAD(P)-dependent dehydrogenase (short-subunit alcohol dehydrogenase family)